MQVVIGGEDEVAFRLAEALMVEHEITLVCPPTLADPAVDNLDLARVSGHVTSKAVLEQAGIADADAFVACNANDEVNLVACVVAKRLGAKRTICYLFRRDFQLDADDTLALAESLNIDQVIRPAEQLSRELLRIVTVPGALDVETFVDGQVRLLRYQIEEDSPIAGASLLDHDIPPGVVLVMGKRDDEMFIPTGKTRFQDGDKITAIGTPRGIHKLLFEHLMGADKRDLRKSATVVGGGIVGLTVAQGLERAGWDVKIIDSDRQRCEQIAPLLKSLVLCGDGSDLHLLEQEQVAADAVLIAVTSNDEKNLLVSLLAKQMDVPRIVTRVDSVDNERLFDKVGVDVVRSSAGAATQTVVRSLFTGRREEILAELEHGDAEVLELTLPDELPQVSLHQLKRPVFAIIGAIVRGRDVIIPRGGDFVQGGDHIIVFCTREDEAEAREFFTRTLAEETR